MKIYQNQDESKLLSDLGFHESPEEIRHKKRVRRMLEDRLEHKRLKDELDDDIDGEFDWSEFEKKI